MFMDDDFDKKKKTLKLKNKTAGEIWAEHKGL